MNPRERGFLLLGSHLGDPARKPLTSPQLRLLAERVQHIGIPLEDRNMEQQDLATLGYGPEMARRILKLLDDEALLDHYLRRGKSLGCTPITRVSDSYPLLPRKRLGLDSPAVLWTRGDLTLLDKPTVALVGSRDLQEDNRKFAVEVGRQAARQGYVLVSGNARGADKTAQESCLAHGGQVISVVADELWKHPLRENLLYLSEDGFDEPFSAIRALSRNRCIHTLGIKTFVAQTGLKTGGTWDGTVKNLRFCWSSVYCFEDGSDGITQLCQMGATPIGMGELNSFYDLPEQTTLF